MRLDKYLSEHFSFSRNRAQQLIDAGLITVDGVLVCRPSVEVSAIANVCIKEDKRIHWVSRSAMKLDSFLSNSGKDIVVADTNCLDVGASTGGFTQVLLERGVSHIDAVDVGTDQLHERLRLDPRVHSYEQTDIRHYQQVGKPAHYDIIVCDASFISLTDIIDAILAFADSNTNIVLLFKPQFEVGKEHLRKTGVPKNDAIIESSKRDFEALLERKMVDILICEKSALIGEAGNQEWIYFIQKKSP